MKNYWVVLLLVVLLFPAFVFTPFSTNSTVQNNDSIVGIMFYNVENMFDTYHDSLKNDSEYTPTGSRRWTYKRLKQKFTNISRVILNAGGWNMPVIVGLCEVENDRVLNSFLYESGLYNLGYRFIHYDSQDERGIDVALLYKQDSYNVIESRPVKVDLGKSERPTRDILYVKGLLLEKDTLHILINHWPSRLGGAIASSPKREITAKTAKNICDSLLLYNINAKIIIMGDFNEDPDTQIMTDILGAGKKTDSFNLVNLALYSEGFQGTIKYQYTWSIFDQIIVSKSLLDESSKIRMNKPTQTIISLPFLLESDPTYSGQRPFRTYSGYKYVGGFSDHLPVWAELRWGSN